MKPELLIQEMPVAGFHNGDLKRSKSRIESAKAWKKQRIVVLLPAAKLISAKVALSFWNLAFPPNNAVARILAIGMEVGEAYSTALESILAHPELSTWEYLLTLEHDNVVPADAVLKLLDSMEANPRFSVISGLYWTKGEGGQPQCWGDVKDPVMNFRPQPPPVPGQLLEVNGTGMGCALWRMKMFRDKKLRRPWFVTQKENGISTQDLYFAVDARQHGYRFAVDGNVRVGHLDVENDICW